MEVRELICIGCPLGCNIKVELEDGVIQTIQGNTCGRGEAYARGEILHPTRTVTSTVYVKGGDRPLVSVKTKEAIPKEKIFECMEELRSLVVQAPITIGDVLLENVAGTGVDIVATKNVTKA